MPEHIAPNVSRPGMPLQFHGFCSVLSLHFHRCNDTPTCTDHGFAKSFSIKGAACKSGVPALKAVELISGGLSPVFQQDGGWSDQS